MFENAVSQVLNILKDHQTPQNERRCKLIEVVAPRFDFTDMARSSLGYHWRQLNTAQQEQFIVVRGVHGRRMLEQTRGLLRPED
jgi:ABC-type transporter MlaC component